MRKVPYYLQVRDHFASQIETAELRPNAKLPSERALSEAFGITRMTARQALLQLAAEGLIHRLDRRGWFVSPPRLQYDPTLNISFTENVVSQGRLPETVLLSQEQTIASTWDFNHLGVAAGEPVFLIRRLRLIDEQPVLVEHLHVSANRCPGLLRFSLKQSLTKLFEEALRNRRTSISCSGTPHGTDRLSGATASGSGGNPGPCISPAPPTTSTTMWSNSIKSSGAPMCWRWRSKCTARLPQPPRFPLRCHLEPV